MKKKSELYPHVTYEKWKTPVSDIPTHELHLGGVLQACFQVFFFLYQGKKHHEETHVLSITRAFPYRIMDEEYADSGIDRYLKYKDPYKKRPKKDSKPWPTWKFWNTDMIKELDEGWALSGYRKPNYKNIIHYMVATGDDTIEFISPVPRWEMHRDIKVEKLIGVYLKKRYREHFGDASK